ncbi:MAG: arsenate reductase (glutaredoxin) [Alphaproteobacteria bacterium]|nr:arsenate reductase (glutaredoxin) [Alphaproteobacteria bacterium]
MTVTIWHNPRCSKSRQTLALLRERGIEPEIVEYLKTPPAAGELEAVLEKLGMEPRDLMRRKEAAYKEAGLGDPALERRQLVEAMAAYPVLIERPVVLAGGKAALGRPPESVLAIL